MTPEHPSKNFTSIFYLVGCSNETDPGAITSQVNQWAKDSCQCELKIFSLFPCGNSGKAHSTQGQQNISEVHSSLGKSAEGMAAAGTYANHLGISCSFCHEVYLWVAAIKNAPGSSIHL